MQAGDVINDDTVVGRKTRCRGQTCRAMAKSVSSDLTESRSSLRIASIFACFDTWILFQNEL